MKVLEYLLNLIKHRPLEHEDGVSATSESGRYTLSYPRGRHNYADEKIVLAVLVASRGQKKLHIHFSCRESEDIFNETVHSE